MDDILSKAKQLRRDMFKTAYGANGGHMASAFSMAEVISVLYFGGVLKYDPLNPDWEERDRFILSKGHACLALYATLSEAGYFSKKELQTFCQPGSYLGGHPKKGDIPGIEASTGALGHGLGFAIGIAIAHKMDNKSNHVFVMLGDGECQEGSVWEGVMSAAHHQLDNLTVIIDHNKLQAMDDMKNILNMEPLGAKWKAFGWNVIEIDGHNIQEILGAFNKKAEESPTVIIAHTIKGKGISLMENKPLWHYRMPNEEELEVVLKELELLREELI